MGLGFSVRAVEEQAKQEIVEENFRKAVDEAKDRMRRERWWHRLFPWVVTIKRR